MFKTEELRALAAELGELGYFASAQEVRQLAAQIHGTGNRGVNQPASGFSMSKAIRGLAFMAGRDCGGDAKADVDYVQKVLVTGSTPGSYLVPEIQASTIVELLGQGSTLRRSGATIWPLNGIQKLSIPTETAEPNVVFQATQDSAITPSDPNLSKVSFDLKASVALVPVPAQLLRASVPGIDQILNRSLARAFGKHEDKACFQGLANGWVEVQEVLGVTTVSQAGASLVYNDLLEVLEASAVAEAEGPFAWYMSPRSFFNGVMRLKDDQNRPLLQPTALTNGVSFTLFGEPVYVTPRILDTEGSPATKSYIVRSNPSYFQFADGGGLEIAVSTDYLFNKNQLAIRAVQLTDFAIAPVAGCVVLNDVTTA